MKRIFATVVLAASFAAISIAAPEERTFVRSMERIYVIDPVKSQSAYEARAVQLMYETILSIDYAARPYRLAPGTCEVPEPSADGLRYSLRLVPGAAVTAEDVAAVFKTSPILKGPRPARGRSRTSRASGSRTRARWRSSFIRARTSSRGFSR